MGETGTGGESPGWGFLVGAGRSVRHSWPEREHWPERRGAGQGGASEEEEGEELRKRRG